MNALLITDDTNLVYMTKYYSQWNYYIYQAQDRPFKTGAYMNHDSPSAKLHVFY